MARTLLLCLSVLLGFCRAQNQNSDTTNYTRPVFLCGGDITGDSGFIASEGFPNYYPPNKRCVWKITVPDGHVVMLTFRLLDMEADPSCRYDYLNIYNGHSETAQRLAHVCGTFRPGALLSTGPHMMLEMVTDEGTGGRGFIAWYSAGSTQPSESQFCGGKLEKPQGSINTPNWPDNNYPSGISCSWHIVAPKEKVVELSFGKFDVEVDSYCRYDYLAVFNGGKSDDTRLVGKFCGDSPPKTVYSDGNEMLVQFVSDLSVTADGFVANYRMRDASEVPKATPTSKPNSTGATDKTKLSKKPTAKPTTKPVLKTTAKPTMKPKPTKAEKLTTTAEPKLKTTKSPGSSSAVKCPQKCRKTGTIHNHYCANQFVATGTVSSLAQGDSEKSLLATVTIIKTYKVEGLSIQESGKIMSIKVINECPKCPILKKGSSYLFMGEIDAEGRGRIVPASFVIAYKASQHTFLTAASKKPC
ncbi:procollagen C-endopeptidase enhancer 1 precursor [Xenopus tropicalis]|uniref:MGC89941 protein n=1 Tax=Xenopus tropicalis TaxID=8364 RepID=Q66IF4_XENTR|nr:procollagen C-endopeptidase enhancer 1 precursor [Xenopus tropicalis]AAH81370.1 MGC89941 protein [Xenopus tropicalis]|eukprot:NP_001008157.1 procollagen C-endopeptidase enhancer 1 precursor [Xenopus tropicalis]